MPSPAYSNFDKRVYCRRYIAVILTFVAMTFIHSSVFSQAKKRSGGPPSSGDTSSNSLVIHQEFDFKATPEQIYHTLLSSKEFSASTKKSFDAFSERSASIDSVVGGTFSLFDGHIIGRILELVPGKRIVEAWRVVDWPAGCYSIARFDLEAQNNGTHLIFEHTGFPQGLKEHLAMGWQQHYWEALDRYLR